MIRVNMKNPYSIVIKLQSVQAMALFSMLKHFSIIELKTNLMHCFCKVRVIDKKSHHK